MATSAWARFPRRCARALRRRVARAVNFLLHPALLVRRLRYGPIYYQAVRYTQLWSEVHTLRPARIVEVGVWRGTTARRLIEEALKVRAVIDYWGFDLFAEGMTPEVLASEKGLAPLSSHEVLRRLERSRARVHLVAGDTKATLARADVPPADLVFIDGGHSYETVASDWANVQRLLHPGSVVYFDDYTDEVGERRGFGVRRLVDALDRSVWRVELVDPPDYYDTAGGRQETRFARVTRMQPVARSAAVDPRDP